MANRYEIAARERKARALAQHLANHGHTPTTANRFTPDDWASHATNAGIKPPSLTTLNRTIDWLDTFTSVAA